MHVNTLSNEQIKQQSLSANIYKQDLAQSCTYRILTGFIHSPAKCTNLFVTPGSRTGSPGDVPNENPQNTHIWMNYSGKGFQWSIHSSVYLCNFWHHHNQEKRNSHLHIPSEFHHKLQKQNRIYLKPVIMLVGGEILPLFTQRLAHVSKQMCRLDRKFFHFLPFVFLL